ncbi:MAG TPA: hypothetical protein VID04_09260 [Methylomirabilota bacterium]
MRLRHVAVLVVALLGLGGCAALGITGGAVTVAAVGAGAGEVLRAGTEYSLTGTALRTFTASMDIMAEVTRSTLSRMAFTIEREEDMSPGRRIVATGIGRTIEIELEPLSPAVTHIELAVKRNFFRRDRSTANEIIVQIELGLVGSPDAADASPPTKD